MDIILLETIRVGNRKRNVGDMVNVRDGFARNFLIPFGKAVPATKDNIAEFENRRNELEAKAQALLSAAQARAKNLEGTALQISANASEEGKLYGSVGTHEISDALKAAGHNIEKKEVLLPDGVFHELGEYKVGVQLHTEVQAEITLNIIASK
jgi:large subunit ribosomal protein L9